LELTPDIPFKSDHCGTCQRCLEACPTQCILSDRTIDASRCISYLTIELKTAIPHDLRPALGNWVFGCDLCQQVCPWNIRFAAQPVSRTTPVDERFAPRPTIPFPDLHQELTLTPEQFNRKFKGSPLKRTKRRGYLRNVAVAIGNLGNPTSTPVLSRALLTDAEPLVRTHCAWALGEIGTPAGHQILTQTEQAEEDNAVLAEIRRSLSKISK
ncbi:MAG: HEAT repeat domain-containing protein, partial [Anaerolineales bacterium]|nr:HEAT repeat domain-containing protein [Anaerolineales bacterium]